MEFTILKSGIRVKRHTPRYLYFHLRTDQGERWRVIALRELLYLTKQDRDRDDILGRQWAAVTDDQVRRAALRECVHVGQHLLRLGHLATTAGVPSECLADANQRAIVHARQVGYRPEPLAFAMGGRR